MFVHFHIALMFCMVTCLLKADPSIVFKHFGPLPKCPDNIPQLDEFCEVSGLKQAGLGVDDRKQVFLRAEACHLWSSLDRFNWIRVTGGPGTGKSLLSWSWALYQASMLKKDILWIHLEIDREPNCVYLNSTGMRSAERISYGQAQYIMQESTADILMLDGCKGTDPSHAPCIRALWGNTNSARKILVSSLGHQGTKDFDVLSGIETHEMPVWQLEQFQRACQNLAFFTSLPKRAFAGFLANNANSQTFKMLSSPSTKWRGDPRGGCLISARRMYWAA